MTAAKEELLALQVTAVSALECSGRPGGGGEGGSMQQKPEQEGEGRGKRRRNDGCLSVFEGVGLVECLFC